MKEEIRLRPHSPRTVKTYQQWITPFADYTGYKGPATLDSEDARSFPTHQAVDRHVAASTQNQAFNALLVLFRHILKADDDLKHKVVRARRTKSIPLVLTRQDVDRVIAAHREPSCLP